MRDAGLPVTAFFTGRPGGVSEGTYASLNVGEHVGDEAQAVAHNRAVVEREAGAPVTFLRPAHGQRVARIDVPGSPAPEADILLTTTPGVALATLAADCVPLLLHDPVTKAVAAAHIGRRGLFVGAVDNAVAAIADIRGQWGTLEAMTAVIGPAICGRCYEVEPTLRAEVAGRHPSALSTTWKGKAALDLPRAVEVRLGQLGLSVVRHRVCTLEDPEYFSYRRDGVTGRQAGVIVCQ